MGSFRWKLHIIGDTCKMGPFCKAHIDILGEKVKCNVVKVSDPCDLTGQISFEKGNRNFVAIHAPPPTQFVCDYIRKADSHTTLGLGSAETIHIFLPKISLSLRCYLLKAFASSSQQS